VTLTSASTTYAAEITSGTTVYGTFATVSVSEGCKVDGNTAATCSATVSISAAGTSTKTASTTTMLGSDVHRFDVLITGGAEKLAAPTGTCASKPNGASGMDHATTLAKVVMCAAALVGFLLL